MRDLWDARPLGRPSKSDARVLSRRVDAGLRKLRVKTPVKAAPVNSTARSTTLSISSLRTVSLIVRDGIRSLPPLPKD